MQIIFTGLDTASTVDILSIISYVSRVFDRISVVSLLQPSPEAVSLFDEIILLSAGGNIIFTGPTDEACDYFRGLGYVQPDAMDNADYLLAVASSDRKHLFRPELGGEEDKKDVPHTPASFASSFASSKEHERIAECQEKEWVHDWAVTESDDGSSKKIDHFRQKYQNSFWVSVWLNMKRSFIIWRRDKIFIRASIIKNIAMGLSVGFVFLDTDLSSSFFGVLFQGNLFIMLGAVSQIVECLSCSGFSLLTQCNIFMPYPKKMTSAPGMLDDRTVFYKHNDSNFYPALSYVIGQALALVPQMILDVLLFVSLHYSLIR